MAGTINRRDRKAGEEIAPIKARARGKAAAAVEDRDKAAAGVKTVDTETRHTFY